VLVYDQWGTLLQEERFTYDALDRRIGVWVDADGSGSEAGEQTWTVYAGANPYADFDGSGALTYRYLYGPALDQLFARVDGAGSSTVWYLGDRQGSVRQLVTTDGTVLDALTYDSYGNILSETNAAAGDRFKYTGREYDAVLGMYYYRARYYAPGVGCFTSEDPLGFAGGDTNLYRYVGNNPTNFTDPSGTESPAYASFYEALAGSRFPAAALEAYDLSRQALQTTRDRFPGVVPYNNEADAWRHAYWSALMSTSERITSGDYSLSAGEFTATYIHYDVPYEIGLAHEEANKRDNPPQPQIEYAMDMHNNNVGLEIGKRLGKGAADRDILDAVDKALRDGQLIFIRNDKLTKPARYQVITRYEREIRLFAIYLRPVYATLETDEVGEPKR
jgi:RHS repeat-associated protein